MATGAEHGLGRLTLRGLECAIIDEGDSVLIDEAFRKVTRPAV